MPERHVTKRGMATIVKEFHQDEADGVWRWFGVTPELLEQARAAVLGLRRVFLRSGDALHLACARGYGFRQVCTNDRHMLAAPPHFQIAGVDVLADIRARLCHAT